MSRKFKWLLWAPLLISLYCPNARGQSITAASCSQTDVQKAFNSIVASTTTVHIPAGICNWTAKVNLNVLSGNTTLSIIGAGTCTGGPPVTSCNDATIIVDDDTVDNDKLLNLVLGGTTTSFFRLSGITVRGGSGGYKQNGFIALQGRSQNMRIDHFHLDCTTYKPGHNGNLRFTQALLGVVDHSVISSNDASSCGIEFWEDGLGAPIGTDSEGDHSFASPTGFGTKQFIYIEDSLFDNPGTVDHSIDDCSHGGRFVFRHDTFNRQGIQTHSTASSGRARGCRAQEVYLNTFLGNDTNPNYRLNFLDSGTALYWGNTAPAGYKEFLDVKSQRSDSTTYPEAASPNGWGYCGTFSGLAGAGSVWDRNSDTVSGYACMDNPGTGQSDLLAGNFPNVIDTVTGTPTWPHQKTEPVYEWMNVWGSKSSGATYFVNQNPGPPSPIALNRDIYLWCAPSSNSGCTSAFNGTQGTGSGVLSARPSTCTAGAGGNTPGVAFWATDQQTLYVCNPTNTWTVYYTPYTYPHPLTQGSGTGTNVAAPSNLSAIVQ